MKSWPTSIKSRAVICWSGLYSRSAHTGEVWACKLVGIPLAARAEVIGLMDEPASAGLNEASTAYAASLACTFEICFLFSNFLAFGPIRSLL